MEDIGRKTWYHRSMKKDLCGGKLHGSLLLLDFGFYVFTNRSTSPTPSGGSIFRCTTKDRGERRAKGVATPFNPPELMQDRILTCFVRTFSQRCV